jgi:ABC-2 type transport system permease protein
MREVLIIVRREYIERVRTRAFLLGTILFPVFMIAIFTLPIMMESGATTTRNFVLVDEAPAPVGERFATTLATPPQGGRGNRYQLERASGSLASVEEELKARVLAEEIDGYIALPSSIVEDNRVIYRARNVGNTNVLSDIRNAASQAVQAERLRRAGLEGVNVAELTRRVDVDDAALTETGARGRGAEATFFFAYILAFLIYFMTAFYGQSLLRSVLEEKTNRIAEVLVSSVAAGRLMLGKIIGVAFAAITQVAIWVVTIVLIATRSDLLTQRFGIPREAFSALTIPLGQGLVLLAFFILGFMMFASLFSAVGAAITSEQEAQSLMFPIMMPLFMPLILSFRITAEPTGTLATVLGLFPLTAPLTMPMRIAAAQIPAVQIIASLVLLFLGLLAMAWIGGKIFRIGILSTGKRPSFREIMLWLKEA